MKIILLKIQEDSEQKQKPSPHSEDLAVAKVIGCGYNDGNTLAFTAHSGNFLLRSVLAKQKHIDNGNSACVRSSYSNSAFTGSLWLN